MYYIHYEAGPVLGFYSINIFNPYKAFEIENAFPSFDKLSRQVFN